MVGTLKSLDFSPSIAVEIALKIEPDRKVATACLLQKPISWYRTAHAPVNVLMRLAALAKRNAACKMALTDIVDKVVKELKGKRKKALNNNEKHPLLPACINSCRKMCYLKIDKNKRKIQKKKIKLNFAGRRLFLEAYITQNKVKYRSQDALKSK